jgi:hypothetical protein
LGRSARGDPTAFRPALESHRFAARVERDVRGGEVNGVDSTPSILSTASCAIGARDVLSLRDFLAGGRTEAQSGGKAPIAMVLSTNGLTNLNPTEIPNMSANESVDSSFDTTRTADLDALNPDSLESEIRRRAYEIFLARGEGDGDDLADWLEAERIVRRHREPEIS